MQRYDKLANGSRVKVIENEWFKIEGSKLQIAEMEFDPYTLQHHAFGFEGSQVFDLPPHMMHILGEALMEAAHAGFDNLEKKFRKEAETLLEQSDTNKKVAQFPKK